ncbi:MAG: DinB family protein [Candidatus Aminicenantes bacterium]|nr:MAG: DinB family protein [Candidatus Aminicenantes bacterium]
MSEQDQMQAEKQEKALNRYAEGVVELDAVLEVLSESHLDLSRGQGKWSIREIVHHIADAEDIWKTCIKAALGNPGCTVDLNWYIIDNKCAGPLDYARRPITDAVDLFKATRRHIVELITHLADAWNQSFTITRSDLPEGKTFKVGDVISFQNLHLRRHIKQIRETREKHGI